jgi:uncharacterized membrane protein YecN with MAPEG domain
MNLHVTPLYAAILSLIFIGLSVRTLLLRRELKIAIGDGGNQKMLRAMRVHANFAEYVPLSLLLIALFEIAGGQFLFVHGLCILLLIGRISHIYGVSQSSENFVFRVFGMAMTLTALGIAACAVLGTYIFGIAH